jgi:pimeloyl-ACP methyl ester carboxylesterase
MTRPSKRLIASSAQLTSGIELSYLRIGVGGRPLLVVHGWPETNRIWRRVIEPLAEAGFDVVAPDLRGFGTSSLAPDGCYDPASMSADLYGLMHEHLGLDRCLGCAGDLGGAVLFDLGLRYRGFVSGQVYFNGPLPRLGDRYARAGIAPLGSLATRPELDYYLRQGTDADTLAATLNSRAVRTEYIAQFYTRRGWAAPGAFSDSEACEMATAFATAVRLRTSFAPYEHALRTRPAPCPPRFAEPSPVPTRVLHGARDRVVPAAFVPMARVAFLECRSVEVLPDAGHFVQWEAPDALCAAVCALD